jgi:hypothetical protein
MPTGGFADHEAGRIEFGSEGGKVGGLVGDRADTPTHVAADKA